MPRPSGGLLVVDPVSGRKIGLDTLGAKVATLLRNARSETELSSKLGPAVPAAALRDRLRFLNEQALIEGPRAERLRRAYSQPPAVAEGVLLLPFATEAGLRHACQACGSCCSATDVGPLPEPVVDAIMEADWSGELPGESRETLFRNVAPSGDAQGIWLTAMRNDQCVFLDEDRLCRVHRKLGVEKKPTPCKQFPYVFSRVGDRIDVSLQMECRAFDRAKAAATPTLEQSESLRELLRQGAPVHTVPAVLEYAPGIVIGRDELDAVEQRLIAAVRAVAPSAGPRAVLVAFASVAGELGRQLREPIDEGDRQLGLERPTPEIDVGVFFDALGAFLHEGASVADSRQLPHLGRRFRTLADALPIWDVAFDPRVFRAIGPEPGELVADVLVAGLLGKEALRRGVSVELGLALLSLKGVLMVVLAASRARAACRVHLVAQDLVDSMVLASKLLRERAMVDFLKDSAETVIQSFIHRIPVITRHAGPHAPPA